MRCPACKTDDAIEAKIVLKLQAPLARGGGVKLSGAFTHDEIKKQRNEQTQNCVCVKCGAAWVYVDGTGLAGAEPPPIP